MLFVFCYKSSIFFMFIFFCGFLSYVFILDCGYVEKCNEIIFLVINLLLLKIQRVYFNGLQYFQYYGVWV